MQKYGPTLLHKKVATQGDLTGLVQCVTELPELSTMVDGAAVVLTDPQKGYTAARIYKAEIKSGETPRWVDVTKDCGPANREDPEVESIGCFYEFDEGSVSGYEDKWLTGYLKVFFALPEHNDVTEALAGKLTHEIMVRKANAFPETPEDGQVIVSRTIDEHGDAPYKDDEHPYKFDDAACTSDYDINYFYRVFHVYESGWWSYTNGPDIPKPRF